MTIARQFETYTMLYERFVVFGAFGTGVASVGIILNICLSILLICRTEKLIKYNLFLIALAILDTIISILYILLMAIGIIYDYVGSLTLYRIWIAYVPVANVVGRVVQPAQTYLIVVVTIERYFAIANVRRKILKFFHQQRVYVLVGLVLFAVAFKVSVSVATGVATNDPISPQNPQFPDQHNVQFP